jgi:hypothetical protein
MFYCPCKKLYYGFLLRKETLGFFHMEKLTDDGSDTKDSSFSPKKKREGKFFSPKEKYVPAHQRLKFPAILPQQIPRAILRISLAYNGSSDPSPPPPPCRVHIFDLVKTPCCLNQWRYRAGAGATRSCII